MPPKKRYNSRFPPVRIKKIMQVSFLIFQNHCESLRIRNRPYFGVGQDLRVVEYTQKFHSTIISCRNTQNMNLNRWNGPKNIIKSDEEIGKVAAAVPVLISRAIEMFMTRLLQDAEKQILQRNARTLTPQHIKQAINSHQVQFSKKKLTKDCVSAVDQKKYSKNNYGSWA